MFDRRTDSRADTTLMRMTQGPYAARRISRKHFRRSVSRPVIHYQIINLAIKRAFQEPLDNALQLDTFIICDR